VARGDEPDERARRPAAEPDTPERRALREALTLGSAGALPPRRAVPRPTVVPSDEPSEGLELDAARGLDDLEGISKRIDALGSVMARKFTQLNDRLDNMALGQPDDASVREFLTALATSFNDLALRVDELHSAVEVGRFERGDTEGVSLLVRNLAESQKGLNERQLLLSESVRQQADGLTAIRSQLADLLSMLRG
jgi:hypothetical protein